MQAIAKEDSEQTVRREISAALLGAAARHQNVAVMALNLSKSQQLISDRLAEQARIAATVPIAPSTLL